MQTTIQGTALLNCYVDESRTVWSSDGTGKVRRWTDGPEQFAMQLTDVEEVRVVGFPENADLLVWLHQAREQGGTPRKVKVVSPAFFQTVKSDPQAVLARMRDAADYISRFTPGLGGWHELTKQDFEMYLLVSAVRREEFGSTLDVLLKRHPAWPAVSFVTTGDVYSAARMLADIIDPRWYVDVKHPTRGSKLRTFLGLTQQNIHYVYYGRGEPGFNWRRCSNVVRSWCRAPNVPAISGGCPEDFIRRCCARHHPLARGVLRASNLYLSFVKSVWLDAMSVQTLFAPDHFFEGDDQQYRDLVVAAYLSHVS